MPRLRTICTSAAEQLLPLRRGAVDAANQRHVELHIVGRDFGQLVQPRLADAEIVVGQLDLQAASERCAAAPARSPW